MKKNLNRSLNIRISEHLEHRLDSIAKRSGQHSLTRLARVALWEFIQKYGNYEEDRIPELLPKLANGEGELDLLDSVWGITTEYTPEDDRKVQEEAERRNGDDGVAEA